MKMLEGLSNDTKWIFLCFELTLLICEVQNNVAWNCFHKSLIS